MQFLATLVSLLLVLYSVKAAAVLPVEERNLVHSRELSKERKELILKLISGLLDEVDNSVLAGDMAPAPLEMEEPLESRLEERAIYNRLSQLPQRDEKPLQKLLLEDLHIVLTAQALQQFHTPP